MARLEFPVIPREDGGESSALVVRCGNGGVIESYQGRRLGTPGVGRHGSGFE